MAQDLLHTNTLCFSAGGDYQDFMFSLCLDLLAKALSLQRPPRHVNTQVLPETLQPLHIGRASPGPKRNSVPCYNSLPHNDLLMSYELLVADPRIARVMLCQGCAGSRTAVSG